MSRLWNDAISRTSAMDDGEDPGDVFAIPDLWRVSKLDSWFNKPSFLFSQTDLNDIDEKLPEGDDHVPTDDGFFALPDLSFGLLSSPPTPSSTDDAADRSALVEIKEKLDDIWKFLEDESLASTRVFRWSVFQDETFEEPQTCYVSEAGPLVFDAALADEQDPLLVENSNSAVIDSEILAASMLALGLGRSSVLFVWNEEESTFQPTIKFMRISGTTLEITNGILEIFLKCGNAIRSLQLFVDMTYRNSKSSSRIALADAASTLLMTLQSHLNIPKANISSFLQLHALFRPAAKLLSIFAALVESQRAAETDESILSDIFDEIQRLEQDSESYRDILLEIISRVTRPFLDFSAEWMGLQRETGLPLDKPGTRKAFVKVDNRIWSDEHGIEAQEPDYVLDLAKVPTFFPTEDLQSIFETGRSLRYLRSHHSDHPLATEHFISSVSPPKLEWNFSFKHVERVEAKALQYEKDLEDAIKQYSPAATSQTVTQLQEGSLDYRADYFGKDFGKGEEYVGEHILASIPTLGEPLEYPISSNRLSILFNRYLSGFGQQYQDEEAAFVPPLSVAPLFSFGPIIAAQARIINGTTMRLFFQSHDLREHLSVLWRYQLLGDGVFSSRLSQALFDPELETAEREAGVARTGGIMGLRLGGRETWPPASSELQLALMGILTESYASTKPLNQNPYSSSRRLKAAIPGDMSFAVREMSSEEIEKCIDPNSLSALDFLRLSYKPSPPLDAIITPVSLHKYDVLFTLLLRTLRLLYTVSRLSQEARSRSQPISPTSHRFSIEAHHFVTSISSYFFSCISSSWLLFERKLDQVEAMLQSDNRLGQHEGLDKLRACHERVLDRILFALLLRKRQQAVMNLLEEIFGIILQFATQSRDLKSEEIGSEEIYTRFRRKVKVFIEVCRGMSEKKGYGERRNELSRRAVTRLGGLFDDEELADENTIPQLLIRLDMSGYYSHAAV